MCGDVNFFLWYIDFRGIVSGVDFVGGVLRNCGNYCRMFINSCCIESKTSTLSNISFYAFGTS